MSRETIKDRAQRALGYIVTENGGRQKVLDAARRTLGYYYPQQDVTIDASQSTITYENVLTSLIYDAGYRTHPSLRVSALYGCARSRCGLVLTSA